MDDLFFLFRELISTNSRGVKVILMSATISVERFADYFSWPVPGTGKKIAMKNIVSKD